MALNPFGGFIHRSPLSSLPHDPPLDLASDCIRDYFGPTVQTVADCLQSRGPSTLSQLITRIRSQCRRVLNVERERLVDRLPLTVNSRFDGPTTGGDGNGSASRPKINKAAGPEHAGYVVDAAPVRAALIVLLQHSLVKVDPPQHHHGSKGGGGGGGGGNNMVHYTYTFLPGRARLLPRYPRYVEHARKSFGGGKAGGGKSSRTGTTSGDYAANVVEEVLIHGRMRTEDLVKSAVGVLRLRVESEQANDEDDDDSKVEGLDEAQLDELSEGVVEALKSLAEAGYLEMVPHIDEVGGGQDDAAGDEGETEFVDGEAETSKKRKRSDTVGRPRSGSTSTSSRKRAEIAEKDVPPGAEDDPKIAALLRTKKNRAFFTVGAVWRVNTHMFHDSLRAFCLGRLVAERYGDRVQSAGSFVSASLKLVARRDHGADYGAVRDDVRFLDERATFCPDEILEYLPGPIRATLEAKLGVAAANLSESLISLAEMDYPSCVHEVEEAHGHPRHGKFEILVNDLIAYLRQRVVHQMVLDHHGEVAARIISILQAKGHLESDAIAEAAMVPAKDVREILHRLYKSNYINLLALQQSKQYNPSNAYYLWNVEDDRLYQTVCNNVCKAFLHLRLRRQHEMELGKDWVERAKEAMVDENDHELDRENYNKFCQGLDRLDNAILQCDETLMVLSDF